MIKVNIKEEVAELEAADKAKFDALTTDAEREAFKPYETKVTPYFKERDGLQIPTHKHIEIPALGKTYVRDLNHDWYLLENHCEYCNDEPPQKTADK